MWRYSTSLIKKRYKLKPQRGNIFFKSLRSERKQFFVDYVVKACGERSITVLYFVCRNLNLYSHCGEQSDIIYKHVFA